MLELRRAKGMVLDPDDPDTRSAGSFFTNPILDAAQARAADRAIRARLGPDGELPVLPGQGPSAAPGQVKLSAAWLIERAGLRQGVPGTGRPGGGVRQAHLGADQSGRQHGRSARAGRARSGTGCGTSFGVDLHPEPLLIGVSCRTDGRSSATSRSDARHENHTCAAYGGCTAGRELVSARWTLTKGPHDTVRRSPIGRFRGRTAAGVALLAAVALAIAGCAGSQEDVVVTVTSTAVAGGHGVRARTARSGGPASDVDRAEHQGPGQRQTEVRVDRHRVPTIR